jgi:hypothetical protein
VKKNLLAILILFFALAGSCYAQAFEWVKGEPYTSARMWRNNVIADNLNNVIISSEGGVDKGVHIIKYDSNGNKLWEKHYLSNGAIGSMSCDASNNIYVVIGCGNNITVDSFVCTSESFGRNLLIKLSPDGALMWLKEINYGFRLADKTDSENNLVACGSFHGTLVLDNFTLTSGNSYTCFYLAKFNSNGQCVMAIQDDGGYEIHVDNNDDIFVKGWFNGTSLTLGKGIHQTTLYSSNGSTYIAKYSNQGVLAWVKQTNTGLLSPDNEGNVYCLGGDSLYNYTYHIVKYGASGNFLSSFATLAVPITNYYSLNMKYSRNHLFVTGGFTGYMKINDSTIYDNGNTRMYIAKLDTLGHLVWFNISDGAGGAAGKDLAFGTSNEIYVTGDIGGGESTFDSYSYSVYQGIFVTKIIDANNAIGINDIKNNNSSLNIYPNPAKDIFYFSYTNAMASVIKITIKNITGSTIFSKQYQVPFRELTQEIDLTGQAKGVYFLEAEAKGKREVRKIVLE